MSRHALARFSRSAWQSRARGLAGQTAQEPPEAAAAACSNSTPEAYIQLDWRGYPDSPVAPGTGRLEFDTFEVRRLRAGVDGQWRGVRFEFTLDPQDLDGTLVKDAYAEFRPGSYEIRFGQFKPPGSREYGTSARQTGFPRTRGARARPLGAARSRRRAARRHRAARSTTTSGSLPATTTDRAVGRA